jgi:outer membrane protein OmpA-like peptidoglycan-associated protein
MVTTSSETGSGMKKAIGKTSIMIALFATTLAGCKTMSNTGKGAVIGTAGGAAVGAAIGKAAGNTAVGAIIGAAVGGTAGVLIGRKMDKQAEEMAKEMKDAEIKREGEGIVVNFKEKVLFAYNRYDLNANAQANLEQLKGYLIKYPETNITVIGHTDAKGTDVYNQTLSENRANAAVNYLKQNGIAGTRLTAIGKGETDPIATNETEEGASANRRVEFVITANEKMKADAKKEAGTN